MFRFLVALVLLALPAAAQQPVPQAPPSRWMDELTWLEFRELVPARIKTVLLTTGTLEPHGVTANGADNLAPVKIAEAIAVDPQINALIAPHIPYGVTGSMAPYPGATHIPPEVYVPYVRAVLLGLVRNGFRNIIIVNGHGGLQTQLLNDLARDVSLEHNVNTLVVNWWSTCSQDAEAVFGNPGGHAGENETAFIQAINPRLVHKELLPKITSTPNPPPATVSATPAPSSIGLYREGAGNPTDFDQKKADEYFRRVNSCVAVAVKDTLKKWEQAGFH